MTPIRGTAAGVPFVALPPLTPDPDAERPLILSWHLMDPPRTETAFAAALPLEDVDAWRVFLALPLSPHRLAPGEAEEVQQRGAEDAVRQLKVPILDGAVAELPAVLDDLATHQGIKARDCVLIGGSDGSAVSAQVALRAQELGITVRGLALISPVARMKAIVDVVAEMFGFEYPWADETLEIAARHDLVARARELARATPTTLVVVGSDDHPDGVVGPARELVDALQDAGANVRLEVVDGMAHALAEEPGTDPAPQTDAAQAVDALVTSWVADEVG